MFIFQNKKLPESSGSFIFFVTIYFTLVLHIPFHVKSAIHFAQFYLFEF